MTKILTHTYLKHVTISANQKEELFAVGETDLDKIASLLTTVNKNKKESLEA